MALEDRERDFEKALGRQLRANAGAGLDCPDAETLAAYHDRVLSNEEMASLKSHIAACPSCQEILATLEVTEAIPLESKDSEKAFAKRALVGLSPMHATPVFSNAAKDAAPAAKSPSVREMPKPKPYMKWVLPAGAIAAGLLIWVAMNESWNRQKLARQSAPAVEIAENRETKQTLSAAPAVTDKVAEPKERQDSKLSATSNELDLERSARAETDKNLKSYSGTRISPNPSRQRGPAMMQNQVQNQIQNNGNLNQSEAYEYRIPAQQTAPKVHANAAASPAAKSQVAAAAAPPPPPATTAASGAGGAVGGERKDQVGMISETVEVTSEAPAVADAKSASTDAAANLPMNGRSVQQLSKLESGVAPDAVTTARKEKQAAEAGRAQSKKTETAFAAGAMTSAALRDVDEFQLSVVRSPDGKVFWVISKEGEVFRSEDGGKTSRKQEIAAGIKAIAGSAPDSNVFWILTQQGIVVRTADGGKHWTTVLVPTTAVFTKIVAQDAVGAIITDASGKISYGTGDGGATWNLTMR